MRLAPLAALSLALCHPGTDALAGNWSLKNGETRSGEAVAFDFEKKVIDLRDPVTGTTTRVPTSELSLRSRQRLLVSPLFYKVDRGESPVPDGRDRIPFYVLAAFAAVVVPGFWISAFLITGRVNPFLSLLGSVGSWIVLGILLACYALLRARFDGGTGYMFFGTTLSIVVTPLFISAVYSCSYARGMLLLGFHLVAALSLFAIALVLVEPIAGEDQVDAWWSESIFKPLGLTYHLPPESGLSVKSAARTTA